MRKPCAAALGFFDGVHAAHMRVLRAAVSYAAAHGMEPVAVTFDRSPKAFVTGVDTPLICTGAGARAHHARGGGYGPRGIAPV